LLEFSAMSDASRNDENRTGALSARRACLKGLLLGAAALPALAAPSGTVAPSGADLASLLEPVRQRYGLPALAAAVMRSGAVRAAGATGVRALGSPQRVTLEDRFHLGSDTKAMTALLAGMVVEAGQLQWESSIGEVLGAEVPGMNPQLAAVTLEQLLSHSGGIPSDTPELLKLYFNTDAFDYNLTPLRLRMLNAWKSHAPVSPPGRAFHYANFGYLIAGAMLEKASATPWEEQITRRIFEPLRLHSAGLGAQATPGKLDAPVGHNIADDGRVTPMYWGAAADMPPALGPAGNAHMSVLDFATWAAWNAGGARRGPALVKPETLARIQRAHIDTGKIPDAKPGTPTQGEYCMGWGLVQWDFMKNPVLQHNGSNSLNLAKVLIDPRADVAVTVVTNFPGPKAEDACTEVMLALTRRELNA
jgi:CubicO group peptidase (beta-lactamase class C family)